MRKDRAAREAMQAAEGGLHADASRLDGSVPGLLREVLRARGEVRSRVPEFDRLAARALPRLAVATALCVIVAAVFVLRERSQASTAATAFESMILGSDDEATGDAIYDAVFGLEGNDG